MYLEEFSLNPKEENLRRIWLSNEIRRYVNKFE